ncbi:MAG TPA: hypothetical protein VER03_17030 [Bryobacteraceae bacterium]|nr:hypothetical protein [Bryobacteraceae bacterium]
MNRLRTTTRRRKTQGGIAVFVEFALTMIVLTPMTIGTIVVGLGLSRYLQTGSVCRSAASLFVRGVNFVVPANQKILGAVSHGLGLADANGNILPNGRGVVILSVLARIGDIECANEGYAANDPRCTNRGRVVVTKRIVIGNRNLRNSIYANPTRPPKPDGSFESAHYVLESAFVAPQFGTNISQGTPTLGPGEITYVAETYFTAPELNLFPGVLSASGFAHKNLF